MPPHKYGLPQLPFGWRWHVKRIIDEDERRVGAMVVAMYASGLPYRKIAAALNVAGFTNRRGQPYTHGSIPHILRAVEQDYPEQAPE